jgi:menaquinone-specific isochorismate synthase
MTHAAPLHDRIPLRARSTAVGDAANVLDFYSPGDFVWIAAEHELVASGITTTVAPAEACARLREFDHTVAPGTPPDAGPRAVGALDFFGRGNLVVPARIVGRAADGRVWQTVIGSAPNAAPLRVASPAPQRFTVEPLMTRSQWCAAVRDALTAIERGLLAKVVLARAVAITADAPFDLRAVLDELRADARGSVVYAAAGGLVGASPELLTRKHGSEVVSRPLAGTGTDIGALEQSDKDAREHRIVVDAVTAALRALATDVVTGDPAAAGFGTLAHLATTVTGTVEPDHVDVLDVVAALQPTPAVAGTPVDAALEFLQRVEPVARDRYAGPCGWIDAQGDGEFVVALRGAQIDGARAVLHAGAGIVTGSDPDAEWVETQRKLRPMLQALVRP